MNIEPNESVLWISQEEEYYLKKQREERREKRRKCVNGREEREKRIFRLFSQSI